jgi:DNA-binding transcriptional LysR family regulator
MGWEAMDLDGLKTFVAIAHSRSFSASANALGRTQPAISRRIALLETELGAPLFERAAGGVVLSQAGRVFLPLAERALAAVRDAGDAVKALQTSEAGPVSVAAVGTLASTHLTEVFKAFAKKSPDVKTTLATATSAQVSELVRRGEAMIGIRYFDDPVPDLSCEPLTQETLVVICSWAHRFAGRQVSGLAQLKGEAWLAFPDVGGQRELSTPHIHALFESRGLGPIAWTPVDSLTAQKRLVEAGFGLALVPESAIAEEIARKTLAHIRVRDLDVANPVTIVLRNGGYLSRAAKSLLAVLRTEFSLERRRRSKG